MPPFAFLQSSKDVPIYNSLQFLAEIALVAVKHQLLLFVFTQIIITVED